MGRTDWREELRRRMAAIKAKKQELRDPVKRYIAQHPWTNHDEKKEQNT